MSNPDCLEPFRFIFGGAQLVRLMLGEPGASPSEIVTPCDERLVRQGNAWECQERR